MEEGAPERSVWISIHTELADIAVLALACDHALGQIAEGVPVDLFRMLRDRFYTHAKPFKLTPEEVRRLYRVLHGLHADGNIASVVHSESKSRVIKILEAAWAAANGTDDLRDRAMAD